MSYIFEEEEQPLVEIVNDIYQNNVCYLAPFMLVALAFTIITFLIGGYIQLIWPLAVIYLFGKLKFTVLQSGEIRILNDQLLICIMCCGITVLFNLF